MKDLSLRALRDEEIREIHMATLKVLENVGVLCSLRKQDTF